MACGANLAGAGILPRGGVVAGASGGTGASLNYNRAGTILTVDQTAQRVVIDWNSFDIGAGDTVNFNQAASSWIAFNIVGPVGRTGVSPLSTLSGALNARGGVWLFSTGGILFGPTATANVGSFAGLTGPLGAAGGLGQLLNPDSTGLFTITLDAPAAGATEAVTVSNGARIVASSGFVVLQGQAMVQDGTVRAFDGVDYDLGEAGQIQFTTTGAGQQLQNVSIATLPGRDRPSLTHGGDTTGAWVEIEAPGGDLRAGYHGVVNLGGAISATGMAPGGGGDGVVLLIGDDQGPAFPGYNGSSLGLDASRATINSAAGVEVVSDSATLGGIAAGGPLQVTTYGPITAAQPVAATGPLLLASAAGAVTTDASLTSDQGVTVTGDAIAVGPGVTVRADALGTGAGDISFQSQGDVGADPTSLLVAGAAGAAPGGNVTVRAGLGTGGGDITLGGVTGLDVFVQSQSHDLAREGGITLAGDVTGADGVTVLTNDIAVAGKPAGTFQVLGQVSSGGFIDLENLGPGAFTIGSKARIASSGGQVFLYAGGDTTIDGGARITGASLLDHTVGELTIASGASVSTTGSTAAPIAPVIPAGSDYSRASGLNLAASRMTIDGTVNAGRSGDIYLEVLGGAPAMIGGGGPGAFLSNTSFQHLHGRDVIIMGGAGEAEGPGSNLVVEDLTLNAANLSALWLGTASERDITIAGQVTPVGTVALQIGFVRLGQGGSYAGGVVTNPGAGGLDGFTPGDIIISGGLGSTTAPLGDVTLTARDDILIGDPQFVAAAEADPAFNALEQSHNFPDFGTNAVFVAAQSLQLAAQGRIVQENTGRNSLTFAGLDILAPAASAPLVFAPAALQGQTIGQTWLADYAVGPSGVALFGTVLVDQTVAIDDVRAAVVPHLLQGGVTSLPLYAINSCDFGDVCASPVPILTFQAPPGPMAAPPGVSDTQAQAMVADPAAALTAGGVTLQPDDDRVGSANPVTESGNGDLSVGPRADCPPSGPHSCPKP